MLASFFLNLTIRNKDIHLSRRFSELVAMSYCWGPGNMTHMASLNLRVGPFRVLDYRVDAQNSMVYYIVALLTQATIAVVHRGTQGTQDMLSDLNGAPVVPNATIFPNLGNQARVHDGFYHHFATYRDAINRGMASARQMYPQYEVVVVGHSLGGAWSYLTAADLVINSQVSLTALYTYGQPMTGNQELVNGLAQTIGINKIFRYVNGNDMIPHLGYAPDGIQPTLPNEKYVEVNSTLIRTCQGGHDTSCSLKIPCLEWSWQHHSDLAGFSMREEFCRMTRVVNSTVYQ
jgi:hypothetical protein